MKIIIDIDDKLYKIIKDPKQLATMVHASRCAEAVENGMPLPKGHGRLGDLDKLEKDMKNSIKAGLWEEGYEKYGNINNVYDCVELVNCADTIIKADKEE